MRHHRRLQVVTTPPWPGFDCASLDMLHKLMWIRSNAFWPFLFFCAPLFSEMITSRVDNLLFLSFFFILELILHHTMAHIFDETSPVFDNVHFQISLVEIKDLDTKNIILFGRMVLSFLKNWIYWEFVFTVEFSEWLCAASYLHKNKLIFYYKRLLLCMTKLVSYQ